MGGSASSSNSSVSDTRIVTNNQLNLLNKNTNNFVANTIINQASVCSAGLNLNQVIDLANIAVGEGDINLNTSQEQNAAISFSCVQLSEFQNNIANGILDEMASALSNTFSTSALSEMAQAASASGSSGFASTGGPSTSSSNSTNYNFYQTTNIDQNLQNILENSITNNLSLSDISNCISQVNNYQTVAASGLSTDKGNVNIGIRQNQAATIVSECIQNKGIANAITNNAAKTLGLQVTNDIKTDSADQVKQAATSVSKSSGFFESIGNAIGAIFGGVLLAWLMPIIIGLIVVCCCISIIVIVIKLLSSAGGSSAPSNDNNNSGNDDDGNDDDNDDNGNGDENDDGKNDDGDENNEDQKGGFINGIFYSANALPNYFDMPIFKKNIFTLRE